MNNKLELYKRIRNILSSINIDEKSSNRIISDCTVVSPLANDKGNAIVSGGNKVVSSKKRKVKKNKQSGNISKPVKF